MTRTGKAPGLVVIVCLWISLCISSPAQQEIFFENFEGGAQMKVDKIQRYPMRPEVVSSDETWPAAFPPPSGMWAARARDTSKKFFGLGSIIAGPEIDLNKPEHRYAAIEAKIYVVPSNSSDTANNALIALNDFGKIENFYRFGFAGGNIYFHYFNGSIFTESLYDPDLASQLTIPGWHTFTIRFDGPSKIFCYVNGKMTFFSPVEQSDITRLRMGVLGWDLNEFRPVIADDFKVTFHSQPPEGAGVSPAATSIAAAPPKPVDATPGSAKPAPTFSPFISSPGTSAATPVPPAQPVTWFTDTNQATLEGRTSGKKFLVLFYQPGHALTRQVEETILNNPLTQGTIAKFIPVRLDRQANQHIASHYHIFKYPSFIVIDMQGRIFWQYNGVIDPDTFNRTLTRF